jgi:membrane-bound lytic murein transglycosylase A
MEPTSYNEIAGWAQDRHAEALVAFRRSCPKLTAGPDVRIATDGGEKTITAGEWARICEAAAGVKTGDARGSRTFFEQNFRPLIVQAPGKFTGYFEPELRGSKVPSRLFTVPVYRKPPDLTDKPYYTRTRRSRQGRAQGQGSGNRLCPGPRRRCSRSRSRAAAASSSPRVARMTLGFDGSNNRPYTAIGCACWSEMGAMKKRRCDLAGDS